jgi:hypothetical protein
MMYVQLGGVRVVSKNYVCVLGIYVARADSLLAREWGNELGRNRRDLHLHPLF